MFTSDKKRLTSDHPKKDPFFQWEISHCRGGAPGPGAYSPFMPNQSGRTFLGSQLGRDELDMTREHKGRKCVLNKCGGGSIF